MVIYCFISFDPLFQPGPGVFWARSAIDPFPFTSCSQQGSQDGGAVTSEGVDNRLYVAHLLGPITLELHWQIGAEERVCGRALGMWALPWSRL